MRVMTWLLGLTLLVGCCKEKQKPDPLDMDPVSVSPANPTTTLPSPEPVPAQPAMVWEESTIKTIPDHCSDAKAVLAVITHEAYSKPGFEWKWVRQVMLANPQFTVVPHAALMPGMVTFQDYDYGTSNAKALVAHCGHGGTCNQVAKAYKRIVRSSKPTVYCGPVPGLGKPVSAVPLWLDGGPKANLPQSGDVISQCARLAACALVKDQTIPGDPGLECQRAPSRFALACASKASCAEVNACAGR
ncbi:MAG TPA: hypothetical protein PLJ27_06550 [Polyangiaceae bacterium]|jgi:hypothetical protein|nr:MAG: hypothetical protein BWY17_01669 [Deltaproteobacteria bacterium ADurb.Bin207]HNS96826.1 hypothetical protein [Polyangiaceae bacterium]HNZ21559.1 hypothetical protein [Polyangiaceae bacterium]HOD21699.1 hypothetical protein [Polyangiaceae bacterium]HOE48142.1 hypothetical protein [Polyangiaceae bacterium]